MMEDLRAEHRPVPEFYRVYHADQFSDAPVFFRRAA